MVHTGYEGEELAAQEPYDLIVLDLMMEEMDGSKSLFLVSGGSFLDVAGAGNTSNLSQSLGAAMNRAGPGRR